jgi:hypothetical protein
MNKTLLILLVLLTLCPSRAATLVMTGPLYDSTMLATPAGGFFMRLVGSTLTFSVSTSPLPEPLPASDYSLMLGSVGGDLSLPFSTHFLGGMSGCRPVYGSERSVTYSLTGDPPSIPIEFIDPGICDAFWRISELTGTVEITPSQLALFSDPYFTVSVRNTGLIVGQTSYTIISVPEPSGMALAAICLGSLATRRQRTIGEQEHCWHQMGRRSFP